ncbi:MAG: phage antirepressor protein [Draconibacterium sp.]|nr:MAG: phage antirepressor protein [Draconibacterium sp.]
MKKETAIKLFQEQSVRVHWDNEQEKWYFSIVDVIGVLTDNEHQGARK